MSEIDFLHKPVPKPKGGTPPPRFVNDPKAKPARATVPTAETHQVNNRWHKFFGGKGGTDAKSSSAVSGGGKQVRMKPADGHSLAAASKFASPQTTVSVSERLVPESPAAEKMAVDAVKKEIKVSAKEKLTKATKPEKKKAAMPPKDRSPKANLLPSEYFEEKNEKRRKERLWVSAVLALVLTVGVYGWLWQVESNQETTLDGLQADINQLNQQASVYKALSNDAGVTEQRLRELEAVFAGHVYWSKFFLDLADYTKTDVAWDGLTVGLSDTVNLAATTTSFTSAFAQEKIFRGAYGFAETAEINGLQQDDQGLVRGTYTLGLDTTQLLAFQEFHMPSDLIYLSTREWHVSPRHVVTMAIAASERNRYLNFSDEQLQADWEAWWQQSGLGQVQWPETDTWQVAVFEQVEAAKLYVRPIAWFKDRPGEIATLPGGFNESLLGVYEWEVNETGEVEVSYLRWDAAQGSLQQVVTFVAIL